MATKGLRRQYLSIKNAEYRRNVTILEEARPVSRWYKKSGWFELVSTRIGLGAPTPARNERSGYFPH
jgi:hypothetical protein